VGVISKSINMAYNGYANQKEASEKKIIRNLFEPNQDAFNTGKHKWKKTLIFTAFLAVC